MPKRSAGILVYRRRGGDLELLLVHPGGPFWAKKDVGAWSIPKGEYVAGEEPLAAARREFEEETGTPIEGRFIALGELTQRGGKIVTAFAVEADFDPASLQKQCLRAGMAAAQRTAPILPGDRSRGVVRSGRSAPKGPCQSERIHHASAGGARVGGVRRGAMTT